MTFIRLDDRFFMEKARAWGMKARTLYLVGLCYCNRELTDGIIPKGMVPVLLAEAEVEKAAVKVLVTAEVWVDAGDYYVVHDYLDHQRSRSQAVKDRATWRRQKNAQRAESTPLSTGGPLTLSTPLSTLLSAQCPPRPEVIGGTTEVTTTNGNETESRARARKDRPT